MSAPSFTIHYKDTFLVMDREGWVQAGRTGLFSRDTRYLSTYRLTLNGFLPRILEVDRPYYFAATFSFTNPTIGVGSHAIAANSLLLRLSRLVREGMHEDIDLTNYAGRPVDLTLVLEVGVDFADIFQVRGLAPVIPRLVQSRWDRVTTSLNLHYQKERFTRTFHLRFVDWSSPPAHGVAKIIFAVNLAPGETWHTCVEGYFQDRPAFNHAKAHAIQPIVAELERWQAAATRIEAPATTTAQGVVRIHEQAVLDLASLRLEQMEGQ